MRTTAITQQIAETITVLAHLDNRDLKDLRFYLEDHLKGLLQEQIHHSYVRDEEARKRSEEEFDYDAALAAHEKDVMDREDRKYDIARELATRVQEPELPW